MTNRTMRCGYVDFTACEMQILEKDPGEGFGAWDIHLDEKASALALSTGILTGTGVPGSGGFSWCSMRTGGISIIPAEGRIGPALRYAGLDHLMITGASEQMWDLSIENGEAVYTPASQVKSAGDIFAEREGWKPSPDSVVVAFGEDGVVEDGCFHLGDAAVSCRFRNRGLQSLTVTGTGKVPVQNSGAFLEACVALSQRCAAHSPREGMARYLSVSGDTEGEFAPLDWDTALPGTVAASLAGVFWGELFPEGEALGELAKLLQAVTGELVAAQVVETAVHRLMKRAKTMGKGAQPHGRDEF